MTMENPIINDETNNQKSISRKQLHKLISYNNNFNSDVFKRDARDHNHDERDAGSLL
ncbi:hypothetical protein C1646_757442 [Rhizophagus diaphanus]|nr:hypothetical protein C1646_757442 [Rhizophagus diaphanus] [Rhizophagus sp. MUCL 43196]